MEEQEKKTYSDVFISEKDPYGSKEPSEILLSESEFPLKLSLEEKFKKIPEKVKKGGERLFVRFLLLSPKKLVLHLVLIMFFVLMAILDPHIYWTIGVFFSFLYLLLGMFNRSIKPMLSFLFSFLIALWANTMLFVVLEDYFSGILNLGVPFSLSAYFLILFLGYLIFAKTDKDAGDFTFAGIFSVLFSFLTGIFINGKTNLSPFSGEMIKFMALSLLCTALGYVGLRFSLKFLKKLLSPFVQKTGKAVNNFLEEKFKKVFKKKTPKISD